MLPLCSIASFVSHPLQLSKPISSKVSTQFAMFESEKTKKRILWASQHGYAFLKSDNNNYAWRVLIKFWNTTEITAKRLPANSTSFCTSQTRKSSWRRFQMELHEKEKLLDFYSPRSCHHIAPQLLEPVLHTIIQWSTIVYNMSLKKYPDVCIGNVDCVVQGVHI